MLGLPCALQPHRTTLAPPTCTRCLNLRASGRKGRQRCAAARAGLVDRSVNSPSSGGMISNNSQRAKVRALKSYLRRQQGAAQGSQGRGWDAGNGGL